MLSYSVVGDVNSVWVVGVMVHGGSADVCVRIILAALWEGGGLTPPAVGPLPAYVRGSVLLSVPLGEVWHDWSYVRYWAYVACLKSSWSYFRIILGLS